MKRAVLYFTAGALACAATPAGAQLSPARTYYGIGRPVPMTLAAPEIAGGGGAAGRAAGPPDQIRLLAPGVESDPGGAGGSEVGRAECSPGAVDLAALFPSLWKSDRPRLLYAQAFAGDEPVGPAVVIEPLLAPEYAPRSDRDGAPVFAAQPAGRARAYSGLRAYVDRHVVLKTSNGELTIELRPDAAPNSAWHFRELVGGGFYTDIRVHRVASLGARAEPDVVQFGDPLILTRDDARAGSGGGGGGGGGGGPGFFIDLEQSTLKNDFGVVSLARGPDPNSAGSQILIALDRDRCAALNGRYAAFAQVVEVPGSADTLMALARTPVDADYRTIEPPVILSATLVDAPPFPKRLGRAVDPRTKPVER